MVGVIAATLRASSPYAVIALLTCVCGTLGWAAVASLLNTGRTRLVLGATALAGFGYLLFYVATDSPIEAWINAVAIAPFAAIKGGPTMSIPSAELNQVSNSSEFQYFQQKLHLILALVTGCIAGWFASS